MANLKYVEDYDNSFDTKAYLNSVYKAFDGPENVEAYLDFRLKELHKFWSIFEPLKSSKNDTSTLLDFGGGPVIVNLVSAAPKVHRIVVAEYTEANRNAMRLWINGNTDAYDWSPYIKYIVKDLEGNVNKETPSFRMQEIKQKIKSIVPGDITKKPIVELNPDDINKQFDVVSTTLCLEVCTSSVTEYKAAVVELCKLVKPGGYLYMAGTLESTFYTFAGERFYVFPLTQEVIEEAMQEGGILGVKFKTQPLKANRELSDAKAGFVAYGRLNY